MVPMRERELQRLCRGVDGVGSEKICKQLRSMCVMRPSTEFDFRLVLKQYQHSVGHYNFNYNNNVISLTYNGSNIFVH